MSLEHDVWLNLAKNAAFMPDGVKFCGIICNAEVWLVKDKAVEEFLRGPSVKSAQVNPVSDASKKERAELRDRFAMAALSDDEYRALIQEGPAVVMVPKKEMLALLNRLKKMEEWAAFGKQAYHTLLCAKEESRNAYERLNFRITQVPND